MIVETQSGGDTIGSFTPGIDQPSSFWSDRRTSTFDVLNETQGGPDTIGNFTPGSDHPSNPRSHRQISTSNAMRQFSTLCSIAGSLLIIFMILRKKKSSTIRTYNRLLFSLSVADIVASCACFVGPAAVPTSFPIAGAKGNTTTCNIQGFFIQWGYCTTYWYNTALMVYFTLTVAYGLKEDTIAARVEPFMHAFAILFPCGCAVTALLLDSFNPAFGGFGGCWIESYPPGCVKSDYVTCARGQHAHILFMAFILIPTYFMTIVLYVSIYLIYQAVRRREHLARQATFRGSTGALEMSSSASMIMLRSAKTKAMMFATVFFATYVFIMLLGTLAWFGKLDGTNKRYLPLFILAGFLSPLQGFFNCMVYIHPRFMRIRRMRKDKSFFWVLWKAITLETIVPQPVKASTKIRTLPGSSQTEIADRTLSYHVNNRNEEKQTSEDEMVNAENSIKDAEISKQIEQDTC